MNRKIVTQFLVLTFSIAVLTWGICAVFGLFGFAVENALWLYTFIAICAFSPTIASYIVLIKNNEVKNFKEWAKNIFAFKSPLRFYLLVLLFCIIDKAPKIIVSGLAEVQPLYMFFGFIPLALVFGGIEEVGWSYVLRPELDKKFGLVISSIIVAVIWAAWHIPVFLPQGRVESIPWFLLFSIDILGMSFALGAIIKITKSVFLCVLFHTLTNAVSMTFSTNDTLLGSVLTACLFIIVSLLAVFIYGRRSKKARV